MEFKLDIPIFSKEFLNYPKINLIKNNFLNYKISKIVLDTRTYTGNGGIFFALKGKSFDAHKFIKNIINQIDYVVISNKKYIIKNFEKKFIIVDNTTLALDYLAYIYRSSFKKLKVIAVAGSNGKTTTKELIKDLLSKKYKVVASKENQNNLFGVAYTLFNIKKDTEFCIVELGISYPNEMDILGKTTRPDYVVITNIGKEHLEFLKDINNVFKEETKILKYLNSNGVAILNKDDEFLRKINFLKQQRWFSLYDSTADIFIKNSKFYKTFTKFSVILKEKGFLDNIEIKTKLLGRYNIYNILSAILTVKTCADINKEEIIASIENFNPVAMRGERFKLNDNLIINESYNANPDSMKETILEFQNIFSKEKKILVLGDMLELGVHSIKEHKNLKNYINEEKIKHIFLVGKYIKHLYKEINKKNNVSYYKTVNKKLIETLISLLNNNKNLVILVKSSHGVGLWKLVEELKLKIKK